MSESTIDVPSVSIGPLPISEPAPIVESPLKERLAEIHSLYSQITSSPAAQDCLTLTMAIATSLNTPMAALDKPLWCVIVAPPSSGKSDAVELLRGQPGKLNTTCYYLSTLSPAALASAFVDQRATPGSKAPSLLKDINGKCLIMGELSALFTTDHKKVREVLGALTDVYDGRFKKATGTQETREIISRFAMIGCIASGSFEEHSGYMQQIGSRFLVYRMPDLTRAQTMSGKRIGSLDPAWRQSVREILMGLITQQMKEVGAVEKPIEVDEVSIDLIFSLAELVARGRGTFRRERMSVEGPYRINTQLLNLLRSIARVSGHTKVESQAIDLVRKVALSTIEPERATVLQLVSGTEGGLSMSELQGCVELSRNTLEKIIREMVRLELLEVDKRATPGQVGRPAQTYRVHPDVSMVFPPTETAPEQFSGTTTNVDAGFWDMPIEALETGLYHEIRKTLTTRKFNTL